MKDIVWGICAALFMAVCVPAQAASFQDLYAQGRAERTRGDFAAAERSLRAAVAAQPDNAEALNLLALVQAYQDHYDDAMATIDRAAALAPNDLDVVLTRARILAWTKRYTEAETAIARVLQAQPNNADALALQGRVLMYQNRPAAAGGAFRRALQLDAANLDAVLGLGDVARAKGDEAGARQYYMQGQKLDPQSRDVADRLQDRVDDTPLWRLDLSAAFSALTRTAQPDWSEQLVALERRLSTTTFLRANVFHARRFSADDLEVGVGATVRLLDGIDASLDAATTPKADFLPVWRIAPGVTARIIDDFTFVLAEGHIRHYKTGTVKSANLGVQRYFWDGRLDLTARFINSFDTTDKHVMGWSIAGGIAPIDRLRLRASYADAPESESGVVADTRSWSAGVSYDVTPTVAVRFGFLRENRERAYIRKEYSGGLTLRFLRIRRLSFFLLIWYASFALAGLSIASLLLLFVRRLIIHARAARRHVRRAELKDMVYAYLNDPAGAPTMKLSVTDQRILLGLVTEMMRGVTGAMRDQLVDMLERSIEKRRVIRELKHAAPDDRGKFAARLFWSKDPEIHAALREVLSDPTPDVVLAAANSLIAAGQNISLIDLVPKLEARDMLGHRGVRDIFRKVAPQNIPALLVLMDDPNPSIAVLAIDATARVPSPLGVRRLMQLAGQAESIDVRAAALRTLGLIGDRATGDAVLASLADPAWEVRAQAAIAAGRLRLAQALPRLCELLRDANWWVQLRAAQALAKLGDAGAAHLDTLRNDPALAPLADFALAERHGA